MRPIVCVAIVMAACVAAASCKPSAVADDGAEPGTSSTAGTVAEASAKSSASSSSSAASSATASAAAGTSASAPSRATSDSATFACLGDLRCAAGKETCCDVSGMERAAKCVVAPAAPAREKAASKIFGIECKEENALPRYTSVSRCDESQDCGDGQVCCEAVDGELPFYDRRCFALGKTSAKSSGPCPGEELCVAGGPACRTPGTSCVDGFCVKPLANPEAGCSSNAECLPEQRCVRSAGAKAECTVHWHDQQSCEKSDDCKDYCVGAKSTCRKFSGAVGLAVGVMFCDCP
ncbi:MAG: hypothetical protein U0271_42085 [Polyangiaceae bacterium]